MSFWTAIVIIVALGVFADILKTRHRAQAGITRDWKGGEVVAAGNDRALEREVAELRERVPVGRLGRPEEVADLAAGLLRNPYLTSQVVSIDGGMHPR